MTDPSFQFSPFAAQTLATFQPVGHNIGSFLTTADNSRLIRASFLSHVFNIPTAIFTIRSDPSLSRGITIESINRASIILDPTYLPKIPYLPEAQFIEIYGDIPDLTDLNQLFPSVQTLIIHGTIQNVTFPKLTQHLYVEIFSPNHIINLPEFLEIFYTPCPFPCLINQDIPDTLISITANIGNILPALRHVQNISRNNTLITPGGNLEDIHTQTRETFPYFKNLLSLHTSDRVPNLQYFKQLESLSCFLSLTPEVVPENVLVASVRDDLSDLVNLKELSLSGPNVESVRIPDKLEALSVKSYFPVNRIPRNLDKLYLETYSLNFNNIPTNCREYGLKIHLGFFDPNIHTFRKLYEFLDKLENVEVLSLWLKVTNPASVLTIPAIKTLKSLKLFVSKEMGHESLRVQFNGHKLSHMEYLECNLGDKVILYVTLPNHLRELVVRKKKNSLHNDRPRVIMANSVPSSVAKLSWGVEVEDLTLNRITNVEELYIDEFRDGMDKYFPKMKKLFVMDVERDWIVPDSVVTLTIGGKGSNVLIPKKVRAVCANGVRLEDSIGTFAYRNGIYYNYMTGLLSDMVRYSEKYDRNKYGRKYMEVAMLDKMDLGDDLIYKNRWDGYNSLFNKRVPGFEYYDRRE